MKRTNTRRRDFPKKHPENAAMLGVAWYRPEEWSRLLEIAADRDELEATYEEWLENAEARLQEMAEAGIYVTRVDIDVRELQDWCIANERPIDGSGRAVFTAEKLRQLHKGKQR